MAAGYTAVTNVAELVPEITEQVDFIFQDKALGRQLVTVKDISGQPGTTVEFPIFTEVAGSSGVTETGTPTSHQLDLSMQTMTVARRSIYVPVGDLAVGSSKDDLVSSISTAVGMAQVKMVDARIFGILTSTTNFATSAGATNGTLTLTHVLAGLLLLEKQEISAVPNCVLNPHQFGKGPRAALAPVANDDGISVSAGEEITKYAQFKGEQYGINWFISNRIASGTVDATADVYGGLLFVPSAIGYGIKTVVNGLEPDREAPKAATGLVLNWFDVAALIRNSKGICKLYSTSA